MKTSFPLILLSLVLAFTACQGTKKNTKTTTNMEPINLVPFKTNYQAKLGQELVYQYTSHPSVGLDSDYTIERKHILAFQEAKTKFKNPDYQKDSTVSGGDEATVSLIFKAINTGSTSLIINEYFRGSLKEKYILEIEVVE